MSVAERLGIPVEHIEQIDLLNKGMLPDASSLFGATFRKVGVVASSEQFGAETAEELQNAQTLLAAALLDQAQHTELGRLSAALSLIAQLVVRANPQKTLGPEGAQLREHLIPEGWEAMSKSWERTRYAWREGLDELLDANKTAEGRAVVQALNEITRLHPADPEPVQVHIQETFPAPKLAFGLSVLGILFSMRTFIKEWRHTRGKR